MSYFELSVLRHEQLAKTGAPDRQSALWLKTLTKFLQHSYAISPRIACKQIEHNTVSNEHFNRHQGAESIVFYGKELVLCE